MIKRSLRRVSTQPDRHDPPAAEGATRRASTTPNPTSRRPFRLGRSKRSQSTVATTSKDDSNRLGDLFISLPHDIHTLILSLLETADILALRQTSTAISLLLNDCASSVTSSTIASTVSPRDVTHITRLYPQPRPTYNLAHLLALLRRHNAILGTTSMLVNFIRMKIYMLRTHHQRHNPILELTQHPLTTTITTALWFINHFLEHHRHLLLAVHPSQHTSKAAQSRFWPCTDCDDSITSLVANFPQNFLLPIYHVYHLLILHLKQSSRAPTYTGTIERALRGWSRKPPGNEQLAMVMLLGGLEELRLITVLKGTYNNRLEILKTFLVKVEESVEDKKIREQQTGLASTSTRGGKMVIGPKGIERIEPVVVGRQSPSVSSTGLSNAAVVADKGKGKAPPGDIEPNTSSTTTTTAAIPPSTLSENLRTSHRPALHLLSEDILTLIPPLEDILLLPLRRRIESEIIDPEKNTHLLDFLPAEERENELESPYRWVDRVVSGEEGITGMAAGEADGHMAASGNGGVDGLANHDSVVTDLSNLHIAGVDDADGGQGVAQPGPSNAQQQHQAPPNVTATGRRPSQGMFGGFSRSMVVAVGRSD